jgi:hypothetical protein
MTNDIPILVYSAHDYGFLKANICNEIVLSGERVNSPIIKTCHATQFFIHKHIRRNFSSRLHYTTKSMNCSKLL